MQVFIYTFKVLNILLSTLKFFTGEFDKRFGTTWGWINLIIFILGDHFLSCPVCLRHVFVVWVYWECVLLLTLLMSPLKSTSSAFSCCTLRPSSSWHSSLSCRSYTHRQISYPLLLLLLLLLINNTFPVQITYFLGQSHHNFAHILPKTQPNFISNRMTILTHTEQQRKYNNYKHCKPFFRKCDL